MRAPGPRPRRRHAPGQHPPPAHSPLPPPLWQLWLLWPLLMMLLMLQGASGSGFFELQILEFSNHHETLASHACCGGGRPPPCTAPCRARFHLCLKEYQSAVTAGGCSFGSASSPVLGSGSFTLPERAAAAHPLTLPFTFRWTRSFTLILQAYDDYNYTDTGETGLIEEAWWSGIVEPSAAWHTLRHTGATASVTYRVRVVCQPNYYNSTCTTFCRPRDDKFGHYTCSTTGDKRCLPGWHGDNCEIPVCKTSCHPTHGRCDRPGDCDCRPGWRGEFCDQCQPYPGCKHGYCNGSSWDCTCDTNWGGILCDQDLNYCGTHEPCQHGGTCENTAPDQYLCTCAEGFSGTNCERVDNPCAPQPCAHGTCHLAPSQATPSTAQAQQGFMCVCERGYTGPLCNTDVDECVSSPCQHGATCRDLIDAFACDCAPGWSGSLCADDVDECAAGETGPCVNAASCTNTIGSYTCTCIAGWTGRHCDVNIDDCAGQCQHGATCIDLVNDFHCACAAGYTGRTCARDVDDCASRPCKNGGECVDLLDAYRCICPVGYSGTDCEDDRDHCAGSPCGNGAPCYNAQGDYYCHCPPDWTGKNCTRRSPAALPVPASCGDGAPCVRGRCVRAPPAPAHCLCEPGYGGPICNDKTEDCSSEPCRNNGTCIEGLEDFTCVCRDGWTGKTCTERDSSGMCSEGACRNGGTCVEEATGWGCVCPPGFGGASCQMAAACQCAHGGSCVPASAGWACACREGYTGVRCEREVDGCASGPCRNGGRCVGGAGWFTCSCASGWGGAECRTPLADCAAAAPCPPHALCTDAPLGYRCLCPPPRAPHARRCLELSAELGQAEAEGDGPGECAAAANATWWWGCNVCWCGEPGDAPACTRLWCGLPDCLAPTAATTQCRTDEVCVPAGSALCLRAPCTPLGECRRVAGRRVEPPPLPAPAWCWPTGGAAAAGSRGSAWCARLALELARERLARGAHVERACGALRRALAAALAPGGARAVLVLLCDLAPDDDDLLELALWSPEEEGAESAALVAEGVRALSELVSRRRLAHHPLLAAALRLRSHSPPVPPASPAPASAQPHPAVGVLVVAALVPLTVCATGVAAALWLRRRRTAAAERSRRCDEEKSNNLQNEENLRRYANPLRDEPKPGATTGSGANSGDVLPAAHSLYKAQNADARNNTAPPPGPRLLDKEFTKRALPLPSPPHPQHPARPDAQPHPTISVLAPPERLTVLV